MRLSTLFVSAALVLAGTSAALPVERGNVLMARFADSDFAGVEARAYDKVPELYVCTDSPRGRTPQRRPRLDIPRRKPTIGSSSRLSSLESPGSQRPSYIETPFLSRSPSPRPGSGFSGSPNSSLYPSTRASIEVSSPYSPSNTGTATFESLSPHLAPSTGTVASESLSRHPSPSTGTVASESSSPHPPPSTGTVASESSSSTHHPPPVDSGSTSSSTHSPPSKSGSGSSTTSTSSRRRRRSLN